eukprot:GSMAST32.ASY1.ANO1.762.1 assembled CDS
MYVLFFFKFEFFFVRNFVPNEFFFKIFFHNTSTAAFKHGRTETIRSLTCKSQFMCKIFDYPPPTRAAYVSNAADHHSTITRQALMGQGADRHLFALRQLSLQKNNNKIQNCPDIFKNVAWNKMNTIILSTSTISSDYLRGGGFGPVNPDCFAIGYGVRSYGSLVSIMSFGRVCFIRISNLSFFFFGFIRNFVPNKFEFFFLKYFSQYVIRRLLLDRVKKLPMT